MKLRIALYISDIDECAKGQCGPHSRQCFNLFSSYDCQCEAGFEFDLATNGYGAGCTGNESRSCTFESSISKIEIGVRSDQLAG